MLKGTYALFGVLLMLFLFLDACSKSDRQFGEFASMPKNAGATALEEDLDEQIEKGYDLPVDAGQRKEAEEDCKKMMELIRKIYAQADKGDALNTALSHDVISEMKDKLKATDNPVLTTEIYAVMENFENVDKFLENCIKGEHGSAVIYQIHSGGGLGRLKFIFDGTDMYVLSASAVWDHENEPAVVYVSYTRVKEWEYTEKGWFCYQMCVPEPPEVTEIMDGSCMLRIKPIADENRKVSEKCLYGLAYQGNNLLCSNWDAGHMEELDYNGLYEYLFAMKYGKKFEPDNYPKGIPQKEFESLMMEYLPVTEEDIQKYAVFDEENKTYVWERLGCLNYAPTYFGTSFPEVTQIKENEDGTVTLTIDAVCRMILCDDAVITHELTIRFSEDGGFKYLENEILYDGVNDIPEYQYRINRQSYTDIQQE